jgi:hypothetical protein
MKMIKDLDSKLLMKIKQFLEENKEEKMKEIKKSRTNNKKIKKKKLLIRLFKYKIIKLKSLNCKRKLNKMLSLIK